MVHHFYSNEHHSRKDAEIAYQLHRYANFIMMTMIIMNSFAASKIFLEQGIIKESAIMLLVPKICLTSLVTFLILLICFIVDDDSTFVFLATLNCIAYAVMNAFTGATIIGIFSGDFVFEFTVKLWYNEEIEDNKCGAALLLINMLIQLVYACYLAPSFSYYMKDFIAEKERHDSLKKSREDNSVEDFNKKSEFNSKIAHAHINETKPINPKVLLRISGRESLAAVAKKKATFIK